MQLRAEVTNSFSSHSKESTATVDRTHMTIQKTGEYRETIWRDECPIAHDTHEDTNIRSARQPHRNKYKRDARGGVAEDNTNR